MPSNAFNLATLLSEAEEKLPRASLPAATQAAGFFSVATSNDLPSSNIGSGVTAYVEDTEKLFFYNGTYWYEVGTTNDAPLDITGVNSSYSLAIDGTATTITAISSDPENFSLTWSYAVTTGSLGSTATIAQADNVFTITPGTSHSDAGVFTITISVTDGTNVTTKDVILSLVFVPEVDILVVGGGGGGSARGGAGGGGGEYKTWTGTLTGGVVYNVSVGAGGEDPYRWAYAAGAGSPSQLYDGTTWRIRAGGGGGGSTTNVQATGSPYYNGGGSTGGGSRDVNTPTFPTNIYNSSTDVGTGYRYRGGYGSGDHGGGGGGASEVGVNVSSNNSSGAWGGDGKQWLDGNYYAGGGGGGVDYQQYNSVSQGGAGGGGNGDEYYADNGDHGTGGGGGGGFDATHSVFVSSAHGHDFYQTGTFGGNGIVIIRVPENETQPTVTGSYWTTTTTGGYTYYKCVRLGAYGGSGLDAQQGHNAITLEFEAVRTTVSGTITWS